MNPDIIKKINTINWEKYGWWFCIAIISFLLFYYVIPLSILASENLRIVQTFDTDEAEFLLLLKNDFITGNFDIKRYVYGHLYYNFGLVILHVIGLFTEVDYQVITITFRLISYFFFSCSLLVLYKFLSFHYFKMIIKV